MRLGKYLSSMTKPELDNLRVQLNLTDDEDIVFNCAAKGYTTSKIAFEYNMSERVVDRKREIINTKINALRGCEEMRKDIPIADKYNLTIDEAAAYFNIGADRIREITDEKKSDLVLMVGTKRLIKRKKMEEYLDRLMVV